MTSTREPVPSDPGPTPASVPSTDRVDMRSVALTGILTLMVMYTLYVAAPLFMPLTLAFLISLTFAPVIRFLKRGGIPPPVSAAVVLTGLITVGCIAVYGLSVPASQWVQKAPQELHRIDYKLYQLLGPMEELKQAKQQLEEAVPGANRDNGGGAQTLRWDPIQWLLTSTWSVVYGLAMSFILLYFLLASGDSFLRKLVRMLRGFENKRNAVETVQDIQRSIARLLATITLINLGLAIAATAILYLTGMPNPVLFGMMVGLFNFAPYVGPLVSTAILLLVALLSFDDIARILLAPGLVLALNALEGQFITPTLAGRQLDLSPVAVFVSIILWGWMWGIFGLLMAVPLLASIKIVCERFESLQPISEFLGQ